MNGKVRCGTAAERPFVVEEGCRKASEVHLGAAALNFVGADAAARYALEWDEQSSKQSGTTGLRLCHRDADPFCLEEGIS